MLRWHMANNHVVKYHKCKDGTKIINHHNSLRTQIIRKLLTVLLVRTGNNILQKRASEKLEEGTKETSLDFSSFFFFLAQMMEKFSIIFSRNIPTILSKNHKIFQRFLKFFWKISYKSTISLIICTKFYQRLSI